MRYYSCFSDPFRVYGLDVLDNENHNYWRLADEDSMRVSEGVRARSKAANGGRIRFRTDADSIHVRLSLHETHVDWGASVCAGESVCVLIGSGITSQYRGVVCAEDFSHLTIEKTIRLCFSGEEKRMRQVTIHLPFNDRIAGLELGVDEADTIAAPAEYTSPEKLLFYGSSITDGYCASIPSNTYSAMLCRWLDCDYQNLGFDGMAKGETAMAEIIAKKDFTVFVMDYDHNAPNPAHLAATHEPFFRIVRNAHPMAPILLCSRPNFFENTAESNLRRDIILQTYQNARAAGDDNVYFVDGETYFGAFGSECCTVDCCHPNDLGFFRMAEKLYAVMQSIANRGR